MRPEERQAWLATIKKGDDVMVPNAGGFSRDYRILIVARLTPAQIVLSDGRRADRKDGGMRGQYGTLNPVTQEDRDKMEQRGLNEWLSAVSPGGHRHRWEMLPLPVLRAMKHAYDTEMAKLDVAGKPVA